jgi:hypothetical protein
VAKYRTTNRDAREQGVQMENVVRALMLGAAPLIAADAGA